MKDEEHIALEWIGTRDVYNAIRLETIIHVYSYKVTHRTLGKDKAPICIELNKSPLDPAFEEEMKEFRYALLLSKVKTELERTHQNDPACNVSGSKDDEGKEIDDEDERTSAEHESSEADFDANGSPNNNGNDDETDTNGNAEGKDNEEETENEDDDEEDDEKNDDEKENDDDDDEGDEQTDDEKKNDDDDSGDDDDDDNDSGYKSESLVIGNTEFIPEQSPAPRSSPPKENPPCDPSLAMPPPKHNKAVANPACDDEMEASPGDDKLEASPRAQPLKERVDLACTKIDLGHDNMYQMGEYQLTMLEYVKDVLNAVNMLSRFSASPCAHAKKGEKKRNGEDEDENRNRSPSRPDESRRNERRTTRHEVGRNSPRNTRSTPPASRSRQQHSSRSKQHSIRPRQSFGSNSEFSFHGKTNREKKNFRQKLMRKESVTMDAIGNFHTYQPYEEGSGKRFEGYNIPVMMKNKDNYSRQVYQSQRNDEIKKANESFGINKKRRDLQEKKS
ncbi:PREDICTED: acidic repeat-containing protein-like [Ipomoea nil]|uniref:acidic repeat-containing protein-like n=1 Tax=Ipomoea nil TaxID=35883 RepID=UPI000901286A|nr:PREDICTED: acidic repeat-containing protein-like [Ipomoea nil]